MRISDWSSDVCSSDLGLKHAAVLASTSVAVFFVYRRNRIGSGYGLYAHQSELRRQSVQFRSEEHTSELQSLMRISYAVFCLNKKHYKPTTRYSQPHFNNKINHSSIIPAFTLHTYNHHHK